MHIEDITKSLQSGSDLKHVENLGCWVVSKHSSVDAILLNNNLSRPQVSGFISQGSYAKPYESAHSNGFEFWPFFARPVHRAEFRKILRKVLVEISRDIAFRNLQALLDRELKQQLYRDTKINLGDVVRSTIFKFFAEQFAISFSKMLEVYRLCDRINIVVGTPLITTKDVSSAESSYNNLLDLVKAEIEQIKNSPAFRSDPSLLSATHKEFTDIQKVAATLFAALSPLPTLIENIIFIGQRMSWLDALTEAIDQDRSSALTAMHEVVRLYGPTAIIPRRAIASSNIVGAKVKNGQPFYCNIQSANRDPAVFVDPTRLDLSRKNSSAHLGFGAGKHRCPASTFSLDMASNIILLLNERIDLSRFEFEFRSAEFTFNQATYW